MAEKWLIRHWCVTNLTEGVNSIRCCGEHNWNLQVNEFSRMQNNSEVLMKKRKISGDS